jgi:peptide/nickel transport system substrate-binding protein
VIASGSATAQKQGGFLHAGHFDSPASMSMLEESTLAVNRPMMGVFNNLVMFDQEVAQNSPQSIVPDLGTGWSWNEEGNELTMPLPGASSGMTASPSRPAMSSAPGIC